MPGLSSISPALSARIEPILQPRTGGTTLSDWSYASIALVVAPTGSTERLGRLNMTRQATRGRFIPRLGYFREVIGELKKVVWPTREEMRRLTIMVIIITIAIGLFLGAIDLGFTRLVDLFLGG